MSAQLMWFRRDLRLEDHPALLRAGADGTVLPLFVVDPALWDVAGAPRRARLAASLEALDRSLGGHLLIRTGDPVRVVPEVAAAVKAGAVHITADAGPYGRRRDAAVAAALAEECGIDLVATGTPYSVGPGTLLNKAGRPYAVFTPFLKAWRAHSHAWPASYPGDGSTKKLRWARRPHALEPEPVPDPGVEEGDGPVFDVSHLDAAGEDAALARWAEFLDGPVREYGEHRDRPDLPGTSQLSAALKFGEIHPRTLLADLEHRRGRRGPGLDVFESELVWREFYADVLWHRPESARDYLRPEFSQLRYDAADGRFDAWTRGETGFPLVDAGMRQLLVEGWMHNRVRMVVASFLVKDLHVEWQHGARWFMRRLRDGDLASNSHNWQWTAGSGTDAAPFFRVFNPVSQGQKFDPDGAYVRRYVPELGHLSGGAVHEPWRHPEGYAHGYPERIVDHAREREEALARYAQRPRPDSGSVPGGK